jgi:hypothetical protein
MKKTEELKKVISTCYSEGIPYRGKLGEFTPRIVEGIAEIEEPWLKAALCFTTLRVLLDTNMDYVSFEVVEGYLRLLEELKSLSKGKEELELIREGIFFIAPELEYLLNAAEEMEKRRRGPEEASKVWERTRELRRRIFNLRWG